MHTCHAAGCKKRVSPEMLMCREHWRAVPAYIKRLVWKHYRHGQCDDWKITHEYAEAARAAVRAVAQIEGRSWEEINDACRVYDMLDPGKNKDSQ